VTLAQMGETFEFDALIALGAVIRGETYHFEIVSNESAAAISRESLETGITIATGVLTTEDVEQARARAQEKCQECDKAAVEMANLLSSLEPDLDDLIDFDEDDFDDDDFDDE